MAATSGSETPVVALSRTEKRLFAEPFCFEFVQVVRLLRMFYPHRSGVGLFRSPDSEVVRFGVHPSLAFPASEVQELEPQKDNPPVLRVNFLGTVGPLGVLPLYYTELVAQRMLARDRTLRDFLDLFHHRLISLFYRSWLKYRFIVGFEQREEDHFSQYLLHEIGLGTPGLQDRQAVPDISLLYYSGLLSQQPRSAEGLTLLLSDFFQTAIRIEQFLGSWYDLTSDSQCSLDDSALENQQLGFGAIVGDQVYDPQSRIRIIIGPLTLSRYLDFLPTGTAYEPLAGLVRLYAGDEFDFEAQLILSRDEVPSFELGAEGDTGPKLGWVSWSKTRTMDYDPSQTVLQLSGR